MLEELIKIDHQIFYAINTGCSNLFFDWLMPILRNKMVWIPLYIFIIAFAIKSYKLKGLYLILFFAAAVGIADFGSASILKPMVDRVRPCNDVTIQSQVISRVPCGSGKSFPSSHATDHFAIALFLIVIFAKKWKFVLPTALIWAAAISFAQVYVGVHFPIDVICGAIFGSIIGFLIAKLFLKYIPLTV
jgi:undecaprenyl-diphosphatase